MIKILKFMKFLSELFILQIKYARISTSLVFTCVFIIFFYLFFSSQFYERRQPTTGNRQRVIWKRDKALLKIRNRYAFAWSLGERCGCIYQAILNDQLVYSRLSISLIIFISPSITCFLIVILYVPAMKAKLPNY